MKNNVNSKIQKNIITSVYILLSTVALCVSVAIFLNSSKPVINENNIFDNPVTSSDSSETSSEDNGIRLVINSPTEKKISTTDPTINFTGTSDPSELLTINNEIVNRSEQGEFSVSLNLEIGNNTFTFSHKKETITYTVNYRYVIINGYEPSQPKSYQSGTTLVVSVTARTGSVVTATLSGTSITLNPTSSVNSQMDSFKTDDSVFSEYSGIFNLPSKNFTDTSLGKITYKATFEGKSESFESGTITVLKDENCNYIAEVVEYNAETFNGVVTDIESIDYSRPTNNYLPKGTVDYTKGGLITTKDNTYVTLRSGQRVYLDRVDKPYNSVKKPVVSINSGTLPDHNEITLSSLVQEGQHTTLTIDTLWKAPFYFSLAPQEYTNPNIQDYTISAVTYSYIDIKFCYATVFNSNITIPYNNPLFSSAQAFEDSGNYTLRLFLKKQGGFYGWDAYYNSNGQLCFEFLNPAKITLYENDYGVNLNGAKILIDVGHGGVDVGAPGFDVKNHNEAIQNMFLANKIKTELESIGAKVFLTRDSDITSSTDQKTSILKSVKPDYCIAIHHNSNISSTPNGFGSYYFNAFSKPASEFIYNSTVKTGIYNDYTLLWHYYYMSRVTNCPVVLTENGYISNPFDYNRIISENFNIAKAQAITKGIVDYFKSIQ